MIFVWLFLFVIIVAVVAGVVMGVKQAAKLKKRTKELGASASLSVQYVDGLPLQPGVKCDLFLLEEKLLIENESQKFEIKNQNIRVATVKSEQEILEKSKSVVGRAVVGGVLLGPLGAIVGGMTGVGNKRKKGKKSHFFILNYLDSKGEMQSVTFMDDMAITLSVFAGQLNKATIQYRPEVVEL